MMTQPQQDDPRRLAEAVRAAVDTATSALAAGSTDEAIAATDEAVRAATRLAELAPEPDVRIELTGLLAGLSAADLLGSERRIATARAAVRVGPVRPPDGRWADESAPSAYVRTRQAYIDALRTVPDNLVWAAGLADEIMEAAFSVPKSAAASVTETALPVRVDLSAVDPSPGNDWRLAWSLNAVARCHDRTLTALPAASDPPDAEVEAQRAAHLAARRSRAQQAVALYHGFLAHGRGLTPLAVGQDGFILFNFLPPVEAVAFLDAGARGMARQYHDQGGAYSDPPTGAGLGFWVGWAYHNLVRAWLRRIDELKASGDDVALADAQRQADEAARKAAELYLQTAHRPREGDDVALPWLLRLRHHFEAALAPGWVGRLSDGTDAEQLALDVLSRLPVADDLIIRRMREVDPAPDYLFRPPGSPGMVVSVGGVPPDALGRWRVPSNVVTDLATVPSEDPATPAGLDRSLIPARLIGDEEAFRTMLQRTDEQLADAAAVFAIPAGLAPADYLARWPDEQSTLADGAAAQDPAGPIANTFAGPGWWNDGVRTPDIYSFDPDTAPTDTDVDPVPLALALPELVRYFCQDELAPTPDRDRQAVRRAWLSTIATTAVPQVRGYLDAIGALSADELAGVFIEAIDPWSHRLDAWISGMAAKRLGELRVAHPRGVRLGGYGWVENLRPDPAEPEPGEEPVFIHCPSAQHAATAAVLRSGDDATGDNPTFSISMDSRRAQAAREILDGIRAGSDLATLLGYRFERSLHDRGLDLLIAPVRRAYPAATASAGTAAGEDARIGVTGVVVDGLSIVRAGEEPLLIVVHPVIVAAGLSLLTVIPSVQALWSELDDVLDAVGDLVVAESVHGLVGGQAVRAGGVADLIGRSTALPDSWRVLQTPLRARAVTHRLVAVPGNPAPGWTADSLSALEPRLDAWLTGQFGPASALKAEVGSLADPARAALTISADQLGTGALRHLLDLADPNHPQLTARVAELTGIAVDQVTIAGPSWARWLGIGQRLTELLRAAEPLLPESGRLGSDQAGELAARVRAYAAAVSAATNPTALAALGAGGDPAAAAAHAMALTELANSTSGDGGSADAPWLAALVDRLSTLLGVRVPLLPLIEVDPSWVEVQPEPVDLAWWLDGWSSIRPAVRRRYELDLLGDPVARHAYQRPAEPSEDWVGGRIDPRRRPRATEHLLADAALPNTPFAGMVLDAWTDVLPGGDSLAEPTETPTELTSVAFRSDRPDAKAPNAILLAVPPDLTVPWTADQLALVVHDALELARIRTVDLGDLPLLDDILPLIRMDTFSAWGYLERDLLNVEALQGAPTLTIDPFRLEPVPRTDEVASGLAARIHDPAWLLSRQWQLGEFAGQDAATPVEVAMSGRADPIHAWRPITDGADWSMVDPLTGPLDAVIEHETTGPDRRDRVLGGALLHAALVAASLDPEPVRRAYPLSPAPPSADQQPPDQQPPALADLAAARYPDAAAVATAVGTGTFAVPAALAVATAFVDRWRPAAGLGPDAFDSSRGRLGFELAAGEVVLTAARYDGEGLDWSTVRVEAERTGPQPPPAPASLPIQGLAVPGPVRYGSMPADRFWEMEDALVDLGATTIDAIDTGRMMLLGFATTYGNDWYLAPLEVPGGTLSRLTEVSVTDTFGRSRALRPGSDEGWSLYRVEGADGLLLMPTTPCWSGPALEEVAILRDENANLVWAVERITTDERGEQVDRRRTETPGEVPAPNASTAQPDYVVETPVPASWSPLVAQQVTPGQVRFQLVPLVDLGHPGPQGTLLTPSFWMREEEVPRQGLVITRKPVLARWHDGSWHRWVRRSRLPSGGEAASGLTFDSLQPSQTWS